MRSKDHGHRRPPAIRVWARSRIYALWLSVWAVIAGIYVWLWPATTPIDRWAHLGEVGSSTVVAMGVLAVFSTAMPGLTLTIWTAFLSLAVAMTDLALAFLAQWHFFLAAIGLASVAILFYNTLLAEWESVLLEWHTDLQRPCGPIEDRAAAMIIRGCLRRHLQDLFNWLGRFAKGHQWVVPCAALAPVLATVPLGLDLVGRVATSLIRTSGESPLAVALFVTTSVLTLICIPAAAVWAVHTSGQQLRHIAARR